MAAVAGMVNFTGSLGDLSAYRMKGTDKIILRSKGGVSRQRIKTDPNYDLTRRNNEEWKACIATAKNIRTALRSLTHVADYNFTGPLHALCKHIQLDDKVNIKGRRPVLLSASSFKLEGFGFNMYNSFDSIVRHPLEYTLDRETATAAIAIPEIINGINLYNPKKQPFFRFVFVLGAVADMVYDERVNVYRPFFSSIPFSATAHTAWHSWKENSAAASLQLSLPDWQQEEGISLILAAGIEFGVPLSNTVVQYVKYSGAGKVLRVV